MKVSVADVKLASRNLIKAAENRESATICRRGMPVVDPVPTRSHIDNRRGLAGCEARLWRSIRTGGSR